MEECSTFSAKMYEIFSNINVNIDEKSIQSQSEEISSSTEVPKVGSPGLDINSSDLCWSETPQVCEQLTFNTTHENNKETFSNPKEENGTTFFHTNHHSLEHYNTNMNAKCYIDMENSSGLETSFYDSESDTNKYISENKSLNTSELPQISEALHLYSISNMSCANISKISTQSTYCLQFPPYYDDIALSTGCNETDMTGPRYCLESNSNAGLQDSANLLPAENEYNSIITPQTISLIRDAITFQDMSAETIHECSIPLHDEEHNLHPDYSVHKNETNEFSNLTSNETDKEQHFSEHFETYNLTVIGESGYHLGNIEDENTTMGIVACPLTPQFLLAYTPSGQIYKVDRLATRPELFKSEEDQKIWDSASGLNSLHGKHHVEKGRHLPESLDKTREQRFKKLLKVEKDKMVPWSEKSNPFILHDVKFMEKEYWLIFLAELLKLYIFIHPALVNGCLSGIQNNDFSKINLLRCSQLLKVIKKLGEDFCCEGIPSKLRSLQTSLKNITSISEDEGNESWLDKEVSAYESKFGSPEKTFTWIFERGAPSYYAVKKQKRRKTLVQSTDNTSLCNSQSGSGKELPSPADSEGIQEDTPPFHISQYSTREIIKHPLLTTPILFHSRLKAMFNHAPNDKTIDILLKNKIIALSERIKQTSINSSQDDLHPLSSEQKTTVNPQFELLNASSNINEEPNYNFLQDRSPSSSPGLVICSPEHESEPGYPVESHGL